MLRHNARGFSIAELVIAMSLLAILSLVVFTFFAPTLRQYLNLQQDGLTFSNLASQSQRIAKVLRGLTDVTAAANSDLTVNAYFSPNDAYVSQIRYYLNGSGTQMLADVIPYSANPPNGTLLTAQKRTFTIIDSFFSTPSVNTFVYLDDAGNTLGLPISDLHTIKAIQVNLAVPVSKPSQSGNDTISIQVSLRNRKTNL